jgi:hypothetical protein
MVLPSLGLNVLAAQTNGIPVFGTMADSYIEAHEDEADSFEAFAKLFPKLYAGRKCLGRLPETLLCNWLQRLDCSSLVEMDDGIKLVRELRAKVVTRKFGLRKVDNANRSLEHLLA